MTPMRCVRLTALALIWCCLQIGWAHAAPASAAGPGISVSPPELTSMGMRTRAIRLSNVSADGNVVVFTDKERDPQLIAKGQVWRLRVFRFTPGSAKPKLTTILMPTADLSQVAISPDGSKALCISDRGTRFIGADLTKGDAQVVFKFKRGEPSFRVMPEVAWFEKGHFHTIGYFMDADEVSTSDAIVSIDVPGRGFGAIHKVRDITTFLKPFKGLQQALWHSAEQAYFVGHGRPETPYMLVSCFGEKSVVVTTAERYTNLAAGENRVVYGAKTGTSYALSVYDTPKAKRWTIDTAGRDLEYTYMSADGKTVVASTFDVKAGKMSTFYAHEADGFKGHPVVGLADLPMGTQRLSADGRVLWMYGPRGLNQYLIPVPKESKSSSPPPKTKTR